MYFQSNTSKKKIIIIFYKLLINSYLIDENNFKEQKTREKWDKNVSF